jgi:hypothetical protein
MKHILKVARKTKPTVDPIRAQKGDTITFSGGVKGRTYFFPDKKLFGVDSLQVSANRREARKIRGGTGLYRYAVWDQEFEDFLEGSSSPIIIVQ